MDEFKYDVHGAILKRMKHLSRREALKGLGITQGTAAPDGVEHSRQREHNEVILVDLHSTGGGLGSELLGN